MWAYLANRARRCARATAVSTIVVAAIGMAPAGASAATVVPAGGDFETLPLSYTWTSGCGLLCSISVARQTSGSNHFLRTSYASVLGVIGTSDGHATIRSGEFTWTQATPLAATLTFDRAATIDGLIGVNSDPTFSAQLVDDTTATTTTLASSTLTADEPALHTLTNAVNPSLLTTGDQYHLQFNESLAALAGVATSATIDLDNVGLQITPATAPTGAASFAIGQITQSGAVASATIDPAGSATSVRVVYGTSTAYGQTTNTTSVPATAGPTSVQLPISGLTPGTTYHAQLRASSAGGSSQSQDITFTTATAAAPTGPAIGTGGLVGSPGERDATLGAGIDPAGQAATYRLDYGTTIAYGQSTAPQSIPAGSGATAVTAALTGLTPGTTYHVRFEATDSNGTSYGPDIVFQTAPLAPPVNPTLSFGGLTTTGAIADAGIDPGASDTAVHVDYGPTASYGQSTSPVTVAGGSGPSSVQIPISGLTASTTYHAQMVAVNTDGTVRTADVTFSTPSVNPPGPVIGATSVGTPIGEQTATLQTKINPAGEAATYAVQYGPDTAYGSTTATGTIPGGSSGATPVSVALGGLSPGTTYHARFTATDADGTSRGVDISFTTATATVPVLGPAQIGSVTSTQATATVTADPGPSATTVAVRYGSTSAYGQTTASRTLPAGAGPSPLSIPITGLSPATTYHAQVVATNADGMARSQDLTFTTTGTGSGGGGAGAGGSGSGVVAPAPSGPGTPTGGQPGTGRTPSGISQCVAVYVTGSARARRLLRLPGGAEVTVKRPLRISISRGVRLAAAARYRLGHAPERALGGRVIVLRPSQLAVGRRMLLTVSLPIRKRGRAVRLGLGLRTVACGSRLTVSRRGRTVSLTIRSSAPVRAAVLTLPSALGVPTSVTVVGITRTRTMRLGAGVSRAHQATIPGLRVRPGRGRVVITGVPSEATGITLTFRPRHTVRGQATAWLSRRRAAAVTLRARIAA